MDVRHIGLLFFLVAACFAVPIDKDEMGDEQPSTAMPKLSGDYYNYTVDEGNPFHLECRYEDLGSDAQVLWRKNTTYLSVGKFPLNSLEGRLSLWDNYTLEISNVRRNDTGNYTCSFGIQKQSLEQNHYVLVQYPPSIVRVVPAREVLVYVGYDLELTCETDGVPRPTVTWKHGHHEKHHAVVDNRLVLKNIQSHDAGHYSCSATNGLGEPAVDSIHVKVVDVKPSPVDATVNVKVNDTVKFACKVTSNPHNHHNHGATVKWHFKDAVLVSENKEEIVIENVKSTDAGVYRCEVGNLVAPYEREFDLKVFLPPAIKVSETWIRADLKSTTKLTCEVDGSPPTTVTWLHNGTQVVTSANKVMTSEGHTNQLIIRGFRPNDFGNYTCVARNNYGTTHGVVTLSGLASPVQMRIPEPASPETNLFFQTTSNSPVTMFKLQYRKVYSPIYDNQLDSREPNWVGVNIPAEKSDLLYTQVYTLTGLKLGETYEVLMSAQNDYGWSNFDEPFKFSVVQASISPTAAIALEEVRTPDPDEPLSGFKDSMVGGTGYVHGKTSVEEEKHAVDDNKQMTTEGGGGSSTPNAAQHLETVQLLSLLTIVALVTFFS